MRSIQLFLLLVLMFAAFTSFAQDNCCNIGPCRTKSQNLATEIIPLLKFIGDGSANPLDNKAALEKAFQIDPVRYNSFKSVIYEILRFTDNASCDSCLERFITADQYISLHRWLGYFNQLQNPVSFPSPEFCQGLRFRLEINQGASSFLATDMAYLGSAKTLITYTIGKKGSCGNKWRLLAGPAFLLQNKTAYAALDTRVAYRLSDIMIKNPPVFLGNWNLFGEYVNTFRHFSYAGLGIEAQLGRYGANLLVNRGFESKHLGFAFGIFVTNKKKK
jgi:hypothetical protein